MPAVDHSFYANEAHGHRYWDWVSEELPRLVAQFFNVSPTREDTFVAGLSMGGYGAFKLALTHPDRYAAAASLSGALDLAAIAADPVRAQLIGRVFDGRIGPGDDLFALLESAPTVPPLHVSCGIGDVLLGASQKFVAAAEEAGANVVTDFRSGGHEWTLWDAVIQDVIAWLPVRTS